MIEVEAGLANEFRKKGLSVIAESELTKRSASVQTNEIGVERTAKRLEAAK